MTEQLPDHLGGHLNKTHVDDGVLKFFMNELGCSSMADIGCGPGGQVERAVGLGYKPAIGADGDFTLNRNGLMGTYVLVDFTKDKLKLMNNIDLIWSCEFVEHVEEQYIPNFMPAFQSGLWVAMTYCPPQPDQPNPHHFNEQPEEYWIDVFKDYGLSYYPDITKEARSWSTMKKPFFQTRGLVFKNDRR